VQHPPNLKRHSVIQVDRYYFVMGGYNFICPNGTGPGEILNTEMHVTVNL
jgi:hypothetical protein